MSRRIKSFEGFLQCTDGVHLLFYQVRELSKGRVELRAQGGRAAFIQEYSTYEAAQPDIQQLKDRRAIEVQGEVEDEVIF